MGTDCSDLESATEADVAFLSIQGLSKHFEGVVAIESLDLSVEAGEIRGIIGPNGSGKTTLINLISGLLEPTQGRIYFLDEDITKVKPHLITKKGIARTFQIPRILPQLTCLENVMLGRHCKHGFDLWGTWLRPPLVRSKQEEAIRGASLEVLEFMGLTEKAERLAGDLSWVEEQLLQISRALVSQPRLLLLDEPTAGMGEAESRAVQAAIKRIQARGVTTIVVAHDMNLISEIADLVTCLSFGVKIAEDRCQLVLSNAKVYEVYLGQD